MLCTWTNCDKPAKFIIRSEYGHKPGEPPNYVGRSCRPHLGDWVDGPVWVERLVVPPVSDLLDPTIPGLRMTKGLKRSLRRRAVRRGTR